MMYIRDNYDEEMTQGASSWNEYYGSTLETTVLMPNWGSNISGVLDTNNHTVKENSLRNWRKPNTWNENWQMNQQLHQNQFQTTGAPIKEAEAKTPVNVAKSNEKSSRNWRKPDTWNDNWQMYEELHQNQFPTTGAPIKEAEAKMPVKVAETSGVLDKNNHINKENTFRHWKEPDTWNDNWQMNEQLHQNQFQTTGAPIKEAEAKTSVGVAETNEKCSRNWRKPDTWNDNWQMEGQLHQNQFQTTGAPIKETKAKKSVRVAKTNGDIAMAPILAHFKAILAKKTVVEVTMDEMLEYGKHYPIENLFNEEFCTTLGRNLDLEGSKVKEWFSKRRLSFQKHKAQEINILGQTALVNHYCVFPKVTTRYQPVPSQCFSKRCTNYQPNVNYVTPPLNSQQVFHTNTNNFLNPNVQPSNINYRMGLNSFGLLRHAYHHHNSHFYANHPYHQTGHKSG